ncbi:hypothetical protein ACQP2E_18925 [Actinoplanes sp. CA-015351]|uniref:hypothetical protein n=1 Tax=Actinoplanes sp. CA-015351 TaxID=3239897 RepID=UPI003D977F8B
MDRIDDWPSPAPELERAYRRLLLAYPGSYRRRHGTEILTLLLEMAEPGRRRPAAADACHLIGSGIRQRFRLPAARPLAWVVALLAALIGGGLGAAAGSWAAQQRLTALPDRAGWQQLARLVAPGGGEHFTNLHEDSTYFAPGYLSDVPVTAWDGEQARRELARAGWAVETAQPVTGLVGFTDAITGVDSTVRVTAYRFSAERDGLVLHTQGWAHDDRGSVVLMLWQQDDGTLLSLSLAGAVTGMIGGWLLAAAGFRRLRRPRAPRPSLAERLIIAAALDRPLTQTTPGHRAPHLPLVAGVLTCLTVAVFALPVTALYDNLARVLARDADAITLDTVHSALTIGARWSFGPPWLNAVLTAAGLALTLTTFVTLRHRPDPLAAATTTT